MTIREHSQRAALRCLFAFLLCYPSGAGELRASGPVAGRIYESLMRLHPRYPQYFAPKALAGCFDWQKSTPEGPDVRYLAVATSMRGGRGNASVGRLASNALDRCQSAQQREGAPCECQIIDRSGSNVLEPPEQFVRRFH